MIDEHHYFKVGKIPRKENQNVSNKAVNIMQ